MSSGKKRKLKSEDEQFWASGRWCCPVCSADWLRIKKTRSRWILRVYTLVCENCGLTFKRRERK